MDIWEWVNRACDQLEERGEQRLAELIDEIPTLVSDDENELVDAVIHEAIALAKRERSPWLELFFRHWNLQSRVLHRFEVTRNLSEAVDLVEFASREDVKQCPQSVCVTQDLTGCYACADGPGYANERIAVAEETLARIDSSWPCFVCISNERASALIDADRAEEALHFIRAQKSALVSPSAGAFRSQTVEALIALGRFEEALEENATSEDEDFDESHEIDQARILARIHRFEEARRALPPFERIEARGDYWMWADASELLALAGAVDNGPVLDGQLSGFAADLERNGVMRLAFRIEHIRTRLALARGDRASAESGLLALERMLPGLRAPLGADVTLRELRDRVLGSPP